MSRIKRLPEHLIDRIAAGEVVERPASVVKELLENSLDAGATDVRVEIKHGGKSSIVVDDDGCGMSADDARLAVARHATSKLASDADLDRIETYGFRGEALSSIAAVSVFRLRTQSEGFAGTELVIRGGELESEREVAGHRGTRIEVQRLFFNVPARRKFLRADSTELAHVVRLVTRTALARPPARFRLEHGGQTLLDTPVAEGFAERVAQIIGRERARKMIPFELESDGLRVHGFAGRPVDSLPRRDSQHVFVNGRSVSDRTIQHAINSAYGETMPRGRYPALVLFLEADLELVDVNVHPQKREVRFSAGRQVHETTRLAIRSALQGAAVVPTLTELRPSGEDVAGRAGGVGEATLSYLERHRESSAGDAAWRVAESRPGSIARPATPLLDRGELRDEESAATTLGQYLESYIVAQDREGILLVDQHAAHERVLFEKYLADADDDTVEIQTLMFPQTIELSAEECSWLLAELDEFRRLGFHIEPFGGTTVRVSAIPAIVSGSDPSELIGELLGQAGTATSAKRDTHALRRRMITTAACHAAIKVNYPLSRPAMQRLLDDLFRVENPSTCPHGRPALFRLSLDEIERAFRRR
ncbi:MAG: DNA mismatch repair endonuclease MutL [Acidobacteria bacterium]|nr:DNA mismatch repair endonuclease MutL [Acidobacteriota bacterium]NIM62141.1 DNA mismatch repair endonuclease MutL [Acidobacteriota bacterium]NIO59795.1 DNA mismatch repair endonuclease MutL [Acidobacteriota bacterium]NIQ30878.1 DNA mismatch repair endonuclease MutL [Acidobacteriota bacterium]NIQ85951.1 DNA mismatch repair endonuclease MutL [Acidobacteriota bacterium]